MSAMRAHEWGWAAERVKEGDHGGGHEGVVAAAIDLARTASGRYDGFWERGLSAWDVVAGGLIVSEAGGRVTDMAGGARIVSDKSIIAAAPMIYDQLFDLVGQK